MQDMQDMQDMQAITCRICIPAGATPCRRPLPKGVDRRPKNASKFQTTKKTFLSQSGDLPGPKGPPKIIQILENAAQERTLAADGSHIEDIVF